MAEEVSQVDIAYQYEMWIGRGEGTIDWTQILGIETLPFPEQVPEDVDVTHMQSPGRTRETIPGLLPVVDAAVEKQYWPEHAGDVLLEELAGLTAAGTRENVLVEFNTGGADPAARRTYQAYVNSFTPNGTVGDKAMVTANLKVMARQDTNERSI